MTTTRKITLCLCMALFILTLLRVPVTNTVHGYASEQSRYVFGIGLHDEVRFDVLLLWWVGIAGAGSAAWFLTRR